MSSWHTSQLTYAFGIGGMMSFYGILGVITYMLPSNIAGPSEKIIIIAFVLLTLPFVLIIAFFASRRRKKREAAEAAGTAAESEPSEAAPAKKITTPAGSFSEIDRGIAEVIQFLKTSNLGLGGRDAVYSLPWFVVAGAPRSGKSSLVVGSNLNFQTLPSQRQSEQKLIRPTSGIDWRVTSEAVFIDTAGRYQTDGSDADEWNGLLEAIRKHRPARPIDGLILAVDAEKVIKSDEREVEEMAKVLRSRLDDAMQRFKVRFPVYIVFTHADGVEGFRDSFSVSKNDGKALVWGATIPLDKSDNAQAMFDPEYDLLHGSVMKRRLLRLSAPFPPVRQLRIFNFPLHFGTARRKFGAFVSTLFRPNPFSESPFLRGFYFTSSLPAKTGANAPQTVGETYFSERLLRDVVLRDKDLVGIFQAQRQRAPLFGWALTLLGAFVVVVLLALTGVSLYNNKQMLDQARDRGEKLLAITKTAAYKDPSKADEKSIRGEMQATDELRELLVRLDEYERKGAPWYMRFGLYSGNSIYKRQLLTNYMSVIENRYKAATITKIQADLKKFAASNPVANPAKLTDAEEQLLGANYDLLKAYLMLTGQFKDKAEPTHIAKTLEKYWTADGKAPAELKPTALQQLEFWAKQVDRDDADFKFPRINADDKLVAATREKLKDFPAVYRYYKRKVDEISKKVDEEIGPMTVPAVLTRNGADPGLMDGTYQVPGAFTKPGFQFMKTAIAEADEKLSEDDWVMGELGKSQVAQTSESKRLEDRYYRDYVDQWRAFVKGSAVRPYNNKKDIATTALQTFSSANSPMKVLLIEINRNTNLVRRPDQLSWWQWIKSWFVSVQDDDSAPKIPPEKEFLPLQAFVGKKDQKEKAPIDTYLAEIGSLYKSFSPLSQEKIKQVADDLANDKDNTLQIRRREGNIDGLLQGFAESASSQELVPLIKQPVSNLVAMLGQDAASQLRKAWTEEILPAAKEIEKGYPFEDGQAESDLTKVSAFLNPVDGKLSKFYKDRLEKYFEESNGRLKVKETADVKFSDEFVTYLNNAFALRKALFGTSQTPKFEYAFALKAGKDSLIEITIDGQKITPEGTASINGSYPAAGSAETGVIVNSGSSGATTTTSPPASNSNSSGTKSATTGDSTSSLKFPGSWGLFRFVDAGKPQKQPGGEYALGYSVGGKSVSATIKPSGGDLFDKNIFRQVKAPQTLMK